ncbi:hypothetical protein PYH37_006099 (plasmid) [Sinorhizobium numidicum]|uniref:Uncharacterized protein n=1 Tax=Sinorhizobium numidicum TaxID=680248 RepID=A0ABY8D7T4_9HYPH|nr:hypothetical protein PYH37_006099 [Sinorhizobium numidicum]WEX85727.1 hypothetical protein PYH38_006288 [Sinorhizobium numidicum]
MDVALQLFDLQPETGDQRIRVRVHCLRAGGQRLRLTTGRALGEDHRMRAGKVVGKLIGRIGHGGMEYIRSRRASGFAHPAELGRQVFCGIRQSMPSSK